MKKRIFKVALTVLLVTGGIFLWKMWLSPTRIAFVNYQIITFGEINKANTNSFIKLKEVSTDNIADLSDYDMVFMNAMGMRITEAQRQQLADISKKVPFLTLSATNPANNICSLEDVDQEFLKQYAQNGGRKNFRNMLLYVRKFVDGKKFRANEPDVVAPRENHLLYHYDVTDADQENKGFETISEYNAYLKQNGLWNEKAPRIIITGAMGEPSAMAKALEETGNMVYCVNSVQRLITTNQIDSINPSAVINMAHGRMGDYMVDYLKKQNIPLFLTLNVNRLKSEWEADKMGMNGGFLSQSVVTPEIDGAIRPFVLFAHEEDAEGLRHVVTIPDRLNTFVKSVNNFIGLKKKPNAEKKVAVYYYKGPGQSAMAAAGMEVAPSLYNLLLNLKKEGYKVDGLPQSAKELENLIQSKGKVFGNYAQGAQQKFIKEAEPAMVSRKQFEQWTQGWLSPEALDEMKKVNGDFPGSQMTNGDQLALARLQFGNVLLMPQGAAAAGTDTFKIIHGANVAPPYTYIASYLWTKNEFKADAIIHFGTHGSLEFTPRKQVALCNNDWPDRLVGEMPHFYIYTIGDVGEAMIAKRRSYAVTQSHLTAPFLESNLRTTYNKLTDAIGSFEKAMENDNQADAQRSAARVRNLSIELGISRELRLDTTANGPAYSEDDIERIESFAEEIINEKIVGQLYTLGVPYEPQRITSSVFAMATDPIAYSVLALDKLKGRASSDVEKHKLQFDSRYMAPAKKLVEQLLGNKVTANDQLVMKVAGIGADELAEARKIEDNSEQDLMAMMMRMQLTSTADKAKKDTANKNGKQPTVSELRKKGLMKSKKVPQMSETTFKMMEKTGKFPKEMMDAIKQEQEWYHGPKLVNDSSKNTGHKGKGGKDSVSKKEGMAAMMAKKGPTYTKEQKAKAHAINEIERAIKNVSNYKLLLQSSPAKELASMTNALNGGYTAPSPGGDPIVNPNTLPTGRNLYGINAENTPTEDAWEKGKALAENTISMYRKAHNDSLPRKVSYTLWSGEFIETGGATIAQVLYMLGVEPIRDAFGRVTDIRLIPSKELGRPRIDVVVQTSGQLRDIAASRLFLINRAVEMAAAASDDEYTNLVKEGVTESERVLVEKGVSPKEAREISTYRVFGAQNGGYGTGIQGMVTAGDKWESEKEIAEVYLNNMGAFYGSEKNWESFRQTAFEAALTRTDVVVQPRQSNTWGALSLDHVYEFMGGLNLTVRNVTGKDPDAYMSDYRNHNRMHMQEVKEAIGVESRTTIFNPTYIKEKMKGGASSAGEFSEIITNTYGWNVMKPKAIDKEMWDEIYDTYVKDKHQLGVRAFFERENPAALEEMTAVMMETARKGMWKASEQQLADIADLHTQLVNKYKPSCSGFVCDNAKLRQFIAQNTNAEQANEYKQNIKEIREQQASNDKKGTVMKKEDLNNPANTSTNVLSGAAAVIGVVAVLALMVWLVRKRRKNNEGE